MIGIHRQCLRVLHNVIELEILAFALGSSNPAYGCSRTAKIPIGSGWIGIKTFAFSCTKLLR